MTFEPWLRRHPVCSFFVMAFGISWGGILLVLRATGFNLVELRPLDTGLIFVFMLLGPSTSGLAMTALLGGRAGLRRLVARMAHWRLALRWYRVLMTWVYANTQSLLLAVLMHASCTGWLLTLYPTTSLAQGLVWQTAFAVVLWLMVAVVMTLLAVRRSGPSVQGPPTREAPGEPQ